MVSRRGRPRRSCFIASRAQWHSLPLAAGQKCDLPARDRAFGHISNAVSVIVPLATSPNSEPRPVWADGDGPTLKECSGTKAFLPRKSPTRKAEIGQTAYFNRKKNYDKVATDCRRRRRSTRSAVSGMNIRRACRVLGFDTAIGQKSPDSVARPRPRTPRAILKRPENSSCRRS
jgi:hypothetical protein